MTLVKGGTAALVLAAIVEVASALAMSSTFVEEAHAFQGFGNTGN